MRLLGVFNAAYLDSLFIYNFFILLLFLFLLNAATVYCFLLDRKNLFFLCKHNYMMKHFYVCNHAYLSSECAQHGYRQWQAFKFCSGKGLCSRWGQSSLTKDFFLPCHCPHKSRQWKNAHVPCLLASMSCPLFTKFLQSLLKVPLQALISLIASMLLWIKWTVKNCITRMKPSTFMKSVK